MPALEQIGLPTNEWAVLIVYQIGARLDKTTSRERESHKAKAQSFTSLKDLKFLFNFKDGTS